MISVYMNYSKEKVCDLPNKRAFDNLVRVACQHDNYGIYRRWEQDGFAYYDCGSVVFAASIADLVKDQNI